MAALLALSFRLLRALALALDLPPEHFRPFFDPPSPFLRPLHYSARASAPEQVHVPSMSLGGRLRAATSHTVWRRTRTIAGRLASHAAGWFAQRSCCEIRQTP